MTASGNAGIGQRTLNYSSFVVAVVVVVDRLTRALQNSFENRVFFLLCLEKVLFFSVSYVNRV